MRIMATDGNIYAVERTHFYNDLQSIMLIGRSGDTICSRAKTELTARGKWSEDMRHWRALSFKAVNGKYDEVYVISPTREYLHELLDKLLMDDFLDLRNEYCFVV